MHDKHRTRVVGLLFIWGVVLLAGTACVPYTVGTTAQTVPVGDTKSFSNIGLVIGGAPEFDSTRAYLSQPVIADAEVRRGVTDDADIGLRVTSGSGIVVNYKQRRSGDAHPDSAAFATMIGAGFVNLGYHAIFEGTLLWSGRRVNELTTYGGLRAMQVIPLKRDAPEDSPSLGGFLGVRIGDSDSYIAPEIGVYYDRSALQNRKGNLLLIPSITLNGIRFPGRFGR